MAEPAEEVLCTLQAPSTLLSSLKGASSSQTLHTVGKDKSRSYGQQSPEENQHRGQARDPSCFPEQRRLDAIRD